MKIEYRRKTRFRQRRSSPLREPAPIYVRDISGPAALSLFLSETAPAAGQSRPSTSRARRRKHGHVRTLHPDSASFCESGLVTARNRHFPSFRHARNGDDVACDHRRASQMTRRRLPAIRLGFVLPIRPNTASKIENSRNLSRLRIPHSITRRSAFGPPWRARRPAIRIWLRSCESIRLPVKNRIFGQCVTLASEGPTTKTATAATR